jgi:8-oxo-dGTP pyrophosphatase MutT (NUDIX family)
LNKLKEELIAISKHPFFFEGFPHAAPESFKAAVLTLFWGERFLDSKILLTLRAPNLATHANQVAFPGGSAEVADENSFIETALRECGEETGIFKSEVEVAGELPRFPTVTGNFEVAPVMGRLLVSNPTFTIDPNEVVRAEWVPVATLRESRFLEKRIVRGVERELPVFMWGEEKMWGLSALIFDLILNRYDRL